MQLQATALTLPKVEAPGPTKQSLKASKDTQQGRLDLHDTVDAILKTVVKLCESEEAARSAKARMEAMRYFEEYDLITQSYRALLGFACANYSELTSYTPILTL